MRVSIYITSHASELDVCNAYLFGLSEPFKNREQIKAARVLHAIYNACGSLGLRVEVM